MRDLARQALCVALLSTVCAAMAQVPATRGAAPDRQARESGITVPKLSRVAGAYAANCSGCHGHLGTSASEIPTLAGRIGYLTRIPEGRIYLTQVPGVASSAASNIEIAEILNWLLLNYSRDQLPANFVPYTAEEVAKQRTPLTDPWARRREIVRKLAAGGFIPSIDVLTLNPPQLY